MNEKRKHKRQEVYNRVSVKGSVQACVRDISESGIKIGIMRTEKITLGKGIKLKIFASVIGSEDISIPCEIKWKQEENIFTNYGLEFTNLDSKKHAVVRKYIDYMNHLNRKFSVVKLEITDETSA